MSLYGKIKSDNPKKDVSIIKDDADRADVLTLVQTIQKTPGGNAYRELLVANAVKSLNEILEFASHDEINTNKVVHASAKLVQNINQLREWDNVEKDLDTTLGYLDEFITKEE